MAKAGNFGDLITADHKVFSEESESRNNHRYAVVVQDLATQWLQSYPCKTKSSQETQKNLMKFLELARKPKVIYNDNSLDLGKSCEESTWNHCTSTPHRSETNGIAERAMRRVREGTSAVFLQSGLGNEWWADSMESYCYLRNIQDLLSDGKTPHERRFGMPFNGPMIPCGAMVDNLPLKKKTSQIYCLMGRRPMKDVLENHLTDRLFRLVHWLSITLFLRKSYRDYISLEEKSCQVYVFVMHCTRVESGKETLWSRTLKNWRRWTHLNSTPEGSMQRKC